MNITQLPNFDKLKSLLKGKKQTIAIIAHRNPDGDAMGSSCALYNFLLKLGHNVHIVVPNAYPQYANWMKDIKRTLVFEWHKKKCIDLFNNVDILFTVDFNDLSRVREFEKYLVQRDSFKALIDHHPEPKDFADFSLSDTSASSASELVYLFMKAVDENMIDTDIAECVYSGIMTDTGCFSYNSSKKLTFDVVGELLDLNIDKDKIYGSVYYNHSYDRMKLFGYTLHEKLVYLPEYNAGYLSLTQEEMRRFNFKIGDSEGFVNIPLSIKGVKLAALFSEKEDVVKVSLRSKKDFHVNQIAAKYFKGGGHPNASGGESDKNMEQTIEFFKTILEEYKEELMND